MRPFWRSPMIVPSPRRSRSTSASSNPSVVCTSASSRASAPSAAPSSISQHIDAARATADPAAQLVQLRDAEPVGVERRPSPSRSARRRRPRSRSSRRARRSRRRGTPPSPLPSRPPAAARAAAPSRRPCELARPAAARTSRSADATSSFSDSSIERAHDVRLMPGRDLGAHVVPRPRLARASLGAAHFVTIGVRPGGISSSDAHVEVAVHASSPRCAGSASRSSPARRAPRRRAPFARSSARCSTPKRCCSSITTTPSERELHALLDQRVRADRGCRPSPSARPARDATRARPRWCGS